MFHFCQGLIYLPTKLIYPTKFYGKKNIPKGPCIIASNHKSNLDAILLAAGTWEKKFYMTKKEVFTNKFTSAFLRGLGCIRIDRQSTDLTAIKKGLSTLKRGKKLVIFPEGMRVNKENEEMGEIKQGVVMFGVKGKVPIVPMYISRKPKAFRRTKIFIGEPFTLEEFYEKRLDKENMELATRKVAGKMKELQNSAIISLTKKK